jgi:hypothetical protein
MSSDFDINLAMFPPYFRIVLWLRNPKFAVKGTQQFAAMQRFGSDWSNSGSGLRTLEVS